MDVKNYKVSELIPYEKNTKKHDKKQINNVAESIKQYGFVQPIVVDKNTVVVIGHCRLLAAKQLGMEDVPCVCVDDLTDEQVRSLRIVDNKSNESEWDFNFLADELAEIDLSGFDFDFLEELSEEEIEGGEIQEKNNVPISVLLKFKNIKEFRQKEKELREFFDKIPEMTVSVGEANED